MLTVLVFIAVLAVLVLTHEFGHFIFARLSGIRVDEFGFGFAPRIGSLAKVKGRWTWRAGKGHDGEAEGTVYSLNLLPLGGFVRIKGESATENGASDADSFQSKSLLSKTLVLVAGVIMNVLTAWVMLSIIFMVGVPEPIEPGVTAANNPNHYIQVLDTQVGSAASVAGIVANDEIIGIEQIKNPTTDQFREVVKAHADQSVLIRIRRNQEELNVTVKPRLDQKTNQVLIGVGIVDIAIKKYSFFSAIREGGLTALDYLRQIFVGFYSLVRSLFGGPSVAGQVAGPIGIAVMTGQAARLGWVYLVHFSAVLSLNLAVLNVLPVPALDGGRLLFIIINAIKRKPVAARTEYLVHSISFLLLIGLVLIVTAKDILGLLGPFVQRLF